MGFGRKRKVVPFRTSGELDAMAAAGAIVGAALMAVSATAKATALWPDGNENASGSARAPPRPGSLTRGRGRRIVRLRIAAASVATIPAVAICAIPLAGATEVAARIAACATQESVSPARVSARIRRVT